jgi:uracil-DNA glycosylase
VPERNPLLGTDWEPLFRQEFEKPYWAKLKEFVAEERSRYSVYPPHDEVFTALLITPYAETKVVILGQDPYHGDGQAHGLAFSVRRGVRVPPLLVNIHRELYDDLGLRSPDHGNLEPWAGRGVLLLNATLTVRAGGATLAPAQRVGDVHRRGGSGRRREDRSRGVHPLGEGRPGKEGARRGVPARAH